LFQHVATPVALSRSRVRPRAPRLVVRHRTRVPGWARDRRSVRRAPRNSGEPGHGNASRPHPPVGHPPCYPPGRPLPLPVVHACRGRAAHTPRKHRPTPRNTPLPSELCVPRLPYKGPPLLTGGASPRFPGRCHRAPPQATPLSSDRPFPAITLELLSVPPRSRRRSTRGAVAPVAATAWCRCPPPPVAPPPQSSMQIGRG
jgi:hypothetical protein